ncbi:MAG: hypothetical protein IPM33_02985 [Phycisphaerales bacterium]|nr:hypothetical protein [Phycisphaerales bacterium]
MCLLLILPACGAPGRQSTRLTAEDLEATTTEIAARLSASAFMASRGPDSPRMVIAVHKVENLTSDVIPEREQWWMIQRVRDSAPLLALSRQRNIRMVMPAEHLREGEARGALPEDFAAQRDPTHEMTATFRSATRAASLARTEVYLVDYRITDLGTGELVFNETFSFKRQAFGRSFD